ncbi:DUF2314 domain-containing protein [Campylobacter sp.]|uniref:DUF2314 domain-containing protein n=1 Tax=Campylobacter sp. TaxID=205 RepID=UPI0026FE1365|nr:DUF2314 domain-containing protein [Campylobacter sp.]
MINFSLDDVEAYEREFGEEFKIPPKQERINLKRGDVVKLIFRFEDEDSEFAQVERMWVIVDDIKDGYFIGILDNEPFTKGCIKAGDLLKFDHTHVLEIYKD